MTIEGVKLLELTTHEDDRGFFREIFRFTELFSDRSVGQLSHSRASQGVTKGWHGHVYQDQWNYVAYGRARVGLVDDRQSSKTYGQTMSFEVDGELQPVGYFFPPGVLHGYTCLSDSMHIIYVTSGVYDLKDELRITNNDLISKLLLPDLKMANERTTENILSVWDARADLGENAGSNDFILKDLETRLIVDSIPENSRVLEVGCGNGSTLIELCKDKGCSGIGLDFSSKMIDLAIEKLSKTDGTLNLEFKVTKAQDVVELGEFDIVLTQRCFGNLPSQDEQRDSIYRIMQNLKQGGRYIMVEDCMQNHDNLNALRSEFGLFEIPPPWFNLFFDAEAVKTWQTDEYKILSGPDAVASTYYMLSRVVYAKLEQDKGTKPENLKYDSDINMMSYKMPNFGNLGAPSLWVWERTKK